MKQEIKERLRADFPAVERLLRALWHLAPGDLTMLKDQREKLLPELVALVEARYMAEVYVAEPTACGTKE